MWGLSMGVTALVWLGIGVAALGTVYGIDHSRQKIGMEKQLAIDQPILAECATTFNAPKPKDCALAMRAAVANAKTATEANATLQQDLQKLAGERQRCSDEVARLAAQSARMRMATAVRKPVEEQKVATLDLEKAELLAALGLADKGGTCEQQLARSAALWKKVAERRARDFPQPPPGSQQQQPDGGDVIIKGPAK